MLVLGTRPQIIKSAPIVKVANRDKDVELEIAHTGQHYDYEMSKVFFEEMNLPDPIVNLNVGSGSHARQTGQILMRLEKTLLDHKPDLVLVPGDTNSTLAGSLCAVKLHIPVGHVEAGARSYDMSMAEEINRRLTDHCSHLLFAATENCVMNLRKEGIPDEQIFLTGDTMYDALLQHETRSSKSRALDKLGLGPRDYVLLTIHRAENVDNPDRLRGIMGAVVRFDKFKVLFPVHPRTEKRLRSLRIYRKLKRQENIIMSKPASYEDMIDLLRNARLVLTDSGGMQKEAFWLHVPCVTLRNNTEWVETVELGANTLSGPDTANILEAADRTLISEQVFEDLRTLPNPFGDGKASGRILRIVKEFLDD